MQARCLPARRGAFWPVAGFHLFRRNPPLLTAATLTYLLLVQLVARLPGVGIFLLPLALPTMILIVANGVRLIDRGGRMMPTGLLQGVRGNEVAMLRLGGLHLVGAFLFVAVLLLLEGGGIALANLEKADDPQVAWVLLRLFVLAIPFLLAFLFAPYLTGWDGVPAAKALFFSFVAAVRNWRALAAYLAVVVLASVLLPGLLLWLAGLLPEFVAKVTQVVVRMMMMFVLAPILTASLYVGYRDIFHPPTDEHA